MIMNSLFKFLIPLTILLYVFIGCAPEYDRNETESNSDEFEARTINTEYEEIHLTKVVGGLEHAWSLAFLPDERILVTERPGRLNVIDNGNVTEISGLPDINIANQGGLLEVSVHPNYEENGWIYLTYSKPNGEDETVTAVARAQLEGNSLSNFEEIFEQDRYSSPGRHYGSRIAWNDDGTMFVSIGDRGADPPRAQDLGDHAGTLLRLNDDGSVPDDNPFIGQNDALPEIYSYGHRNIQGLVIDPSTGDIWGTEHGPRGSDELNFIEPTLNYGWPTVTLGRDYGTEDEFGHAEARSMDGMIDPVWEFLPTLAPSGLAMVTHNQFPNWEGNLLAGGLRAERIMRIVIEDQEVIHMEELILGEIGRVRDIREGPDGNIYIVNDQSDGGLFRIEPAN